MNVTNLLKKEIKLETSMSVYIWLICLIAFYYIPAYPVYIGCFYILQKVCFFYDYLVSFFECAVKEVLKREAQSSGSSAARIVGIDRSIESLFGGFYKAFYPFIHYLYL